MPNYSNQYTPHKKEQHRRHAKYFYNNQVRAYMSADSPNLIFTHNDGNGPSGSILDPGSILVSFSDESSSIFDTQFGNSFSFCMNWTHSNDLHNQNSASLRNSGTASIFLTYDYGEKGVFFHNAQIQFAGNRQPFSMSFQYSTPRDPDNFKKIRQWSRSLSGVSSSEDDIYNDTNIYIYPRTSPFMFQDTYPGRVRKIRYTFDAPQYGGLPSQINQNNQLAIRELRSYVVEDGDLFKDYVVDFDDSLLDMASWKGARHTGCRLRAARLNNYTKGDITYGLNPVIESKVVALYVGSTLVGGDITNTEAEESSYTRISGHSYINLNKVLLINLETDEVEVIDRQNTGNEAFLRLISRDFPEGSTCNFKLLDISTDNSLKNEYRIKFNRGSLQKLYRYKANKRGFEDGVFGGFGVRHNVGNVKTGSLQGTGLFGYGMTALASRSLFTTNSINFVDALPSELNLYAGEEDTSTLGI